MRIPTRVTAAPLRELDTNGKWNIMIPTDEGIISLREAVELTGIPRETLRKRLRDNWRDKNVLNPNHRQKKEHIDARVASIAQTTALAGSYLPSRNSKRNIEDFPSYGTWELARPSDDEVSERRKRFLAQREIRDQEYRDALKHHRAVCG